MTDATSAGGSETTESGRTHPVTLFTGQWADLTLEEVERQHIERVLAEEEGRVAQAALRLAVPRSTLYLKIKSYGIKTS